MWGVLAKTNRKYKIIVPRWRYQRCLPKMILVPKEKVPSHLTTLLSWSYDDPTPVHSHPTMVDGAFFQINSKVAISKGGGKAHLRPFEYVGSLSFHQHFLNHKTLVTQDQTRVCPAQATSLHCWPKLGFEFAQGCFDLQCPMWISYFMLDSQVCPYQVSSPDSNFCPVNWTIDLEINYIGE